MATGNILAEGNIDRVKLISRFLTPVSVAANTTATQSFAIPGLQTGDWIAPTMTVATAGIGIVDARVGANDTMTVTFCNTTGGPIVPTANTFRILVVRSDGTLNAF